MDWGNQPMNRSWDVQADSLVMAAHRMRKSTTEILELLLQDEYSSRIFKIEVTASLQRQEAVERNEQRSITAPTPRSLPVVPMPPVARRWWDPQADDLVLAAHSKRKAIAEISQQLNATAYSATKVQVMASLQKQGVQDATWGCHAAETRPS